MHLHDPDAGRFFRLHRTGVPPRLYRKRVRNVHPSGGTDRPAEQLCSAGSDYVCAGRDSMRAAGEQDMGGRQASADPYAGRLEGPAERLTEEGQGYADEMPTLSLPEDRLRLFWHTAEDPGFLCLFSENQKYAGGIIP